MCPSGRIDGMRALICVEMAVKSIAHVHALRDSISCSSSNGIHSGESAGHETRSASYRRHSGRVPLCTDGLLSESPNDDDFQLYIKYLVGLHEQLVQLIAHDSD